MAAKNPRVGRSSPDRRGVGVANLRGEALPAASLISPAPPSRQRERAARFAGRLRAAMSEKGIGTNELAARVKALFPENQIGPVLVSYYRNGRRLPRDGNLEALSRALGVDAAILLPDQDRAKRRRDRRRRPDLSIEARGNRIWIRIEQELPWPVGLAVLAALKGI